MHGDKLNLHRLANRPNVVIDEARLRQRVETESEPTKVDLTDKEVLLRLEQIQLAAENNIKYVEKKGILGTEPVYYFPITSKKKAEDQLKGFLPPTFNKSTEPNKIPLWRQKRASNPSADSNPVTVTMDQDSDDTMYESSASGNWIDDVVKEALRRQEDPRKYVHRLLVMVGVFLFYRFFRWLITPAVNWVFQEIDGFFKVSIQWWIKTTYLMFFVKWSYKLIKGPDQCYDLALDSRQRALLGLKPGPDIQHVRRVPKYTANRKE